MRRRRLWNARTLLVPFLLLAGAVTTATPAGAAPLTVTTTADSGAGSLRDAIASSASGDTITFASNLAGGTITLTSGELSISHDLTITGPGATGVTVSGNNASRVFHVVSGNVALSGLTVTKGSFTGSATQSGGGGIGDDGGNLTLDHMTITANSATLSGGASYQGGGGVFNHTGTLTITHSVITNNTLSITGTTGEAKGGAGVFNIGLGMTVSDSTISGNTETIEGGDTLGGAGIFHAFRSSHPALSVSGTTISGNSATMTGAPGVNDSGGGGIYDDVGGLVITASTLDHNVATIPPGSGHPNNGGGAVFEDGGAMTIVDTTVSANSLVQQGPNSTNGGGGGVYQNVPRPTVLLNDTIAGNAATFQGGGVANNDQTPFTITNTIIANNSAPTSRNCYNNGGGFSSQGHNLESADTCSFHAAGDIINKDPKLGSLRVNGSPPATQALLAGSPAIDTATNSGCPATDERGIPRPKGKACDMGAYEVVPTALKVTVSGEGSVASSPAAIACPKRCASSFDLGTTVVLREKPASGWTFVAWGGACHGKGRCSVVMSKQQAVSARFAKKH